MKKLLVKAFVIFIGGWTGWSLGWILFAAISTEYSELPQRTSVLFSALLYLSTLVGAVLANRIKVNTLPFPFVFKRGLWLIGLNLWVGILGLAIALGGLENILQSLRPLTAIIMAIFYSLVVVLIVLELPIVPVRRWITVVCGLVLLTLVPVLFEYISSSVGYTRNEKIHSRSIIRKQSPKSKNTPSY